MHGSSRKVNRRVDGEQIPSAEEKKEAGRQLIGQVVAVLVAGSCQVVIEGP